jgi:hypothetical protein
MTWEETKVCHLTVPLKLQAEVRVGKPVLGEMGRLDHT